MGSELHSALASALLAAVALAGCAVGGDGGKGTTIDRDTFELESGTGAIAGLLVDDRFRPIHLVDGAVETEFQAQGFILLQETGEQVRTTENGEFTFVDLDPGTYTLRVQATGHEATPQRVGVVEGVFNELSVVARRVSSAGSSILTQEYSVFIPCAVRVVANGYTVGRLYDASGDTFRSSFDSNYTAFGDQATWLITEMKPNQRGGYRVQVRVDEYPGYDDGFYRYGTENNYDTDTSRSRTSSASPTRWTTSTRTTSPGRTMPNSTRSSSP